MSALNGNSPVLFQQLAPIATAVGARWYGRRSNAFAPSISNRPKAFSAWTTSMPDPVAIWDQRRDFRGDCRGLPRWRTLPLFPEDAMK